MGGHDDYMLRRTGRPSGMVQRSQLFASQQANGRERVCVKARMQAESDDGANTAWTDGRRSHGKNRTVAPSQLLAEQT